MAFYRPLINFQILHLPLIEQWQRQSGKYLLRLACISVPVSTWIMIRKRGRGIWNLSSIQSYFQEPQYKDKIVINLLMFLIDTPMLSKRYLSKRPQIFSTDTELVSVKFGSTFPEHLESSLKDHPTSNMILTKSICYTCNPRWFWWDDIHPNCNPW